MRLGLAVLFASILTLALVVACSDDGPQTSPDGAASCKPSVVNSCTDKLRYCEANTSICKACPAGMFNCDGINDCESPTDCASGGCELFGAKTCGSQNRYCDVASSTCKPCASGTSNCSLNGGDCECTTGCDGTSCKTECKAATGCTDTSKYCDFGTCKPCPAGKFNCNNKDDCECSGGCNGTICKGSTTCDYSDADVCGGDTTQWCWQGKCQACSTGWFNCNKTKGCECDSAGCNGAACAGTCSGGECP